MNKTITEQRARDIAHSWHGGQWSKLYSFASTGIVTPSKGLKLLKEIQECLEPEYYLYPSILSIKDRKDLDSLIRYVTNKLPYIVVWDKHIAYGYLIPYAEGAIKEEIEPLHLMI